MRIVICVLICLFLTSCAYMGITTVEVKGDDLNIPLGLMPPASGDIVKATITRQCYWSVFKKDDTPPLSNVIVRNAEDVLVLQKQK